MRSNAKTRRSVFAKGSAGPSHDARVEQRTKKNTDGARFFLTLIFAKTIPSLAAKNTLQLIRLITGRTGKMATKKAAKKVAKKAAKKK
jgi:hypothetical protein